MILLEFDLRWPELDGKGRETGMALIKMVKFSFQTHSVLNSMASTVMIIAFTSLTAIWSGGTTKEPASARVEVLSHAHVVVTRYLHELQLHWFMETLSQMLKEHCVAHGKWHRTA